MERTRAARRIFALSFTLVLMIGQSHAEISVVSGRYAELSLTKQERAVLAETPARLVSEPSHSLETAFSGEQFVATVHDGRGDSSIEYPLVANFSYPPVLFSDGREIVPSVECKGALYPIVWDKCEETSKAYYTVPDYGRVKVRPVSLTKDEVLWVISELEAATRAQRAKSDKPIRVLKIRYIDDLDCYIVRGEADKGSFSGYVPARGSESCGPTNIRDLGAL